MHKFDVNPHVAIGPVRLGASRLEVREALLATGFPLESTRGAMDYFCEAAIQVEFDDQQRSDFIGFAWHQAYSVFYEGLNVFDTPAQDLFVAAADRDGSGAHSYSEVEYCFPGQILTLWDADSQYDYLQAGRRIVWAQVGLGSSSYLDAIKAIRDA